MKIVGKCDICGQEDAVVLIKKGKGKCLACGREYKICPDLNDDTKSEIDGSGADETTFKKIDLD